MQERETNLDTSRVSFFRYARYARERGLLDGSAALSRCIVCVCVSRNTRGYTLPYFTLGLKPTGIGASRRTRRHPEARASRSTSHARSRDVHTTCDLARSGRSGQRVRTETFDWVPHSSCSNSLRFFSWLLFSPKRWDACPSVPNLTSLPAKPRRAVAMAAARRAIPLELCIADSSTSD